MIWQLYPTACLAILFLVTTALAQPSQIPTQARPIPGAEQFLRFGNSIFRSEVSSKQFPLRLPRVAAPVRQVKWSQGDTVKELVVAPEPEYWVLTTKDQLTEPGLITIELDAPAALIDELAAIRSAADGSFWLPAHLATTVGEKLRYEPQPHKNTVGYWTGAQDKAQWRFQLDKPGRFNVAVLQGCGQGQGGSLATLTVRPLSAGSPGETSVQEFEVQETGHFQNFQWKQLQVIQLQQAGDYSLEVAPKAIRKNALMDIRAIQLIRLPE